jgi:V/A-type H+-transporting ATPase subunit I
VLVHGARLNLLEFSRHLGVAWSGVPYQPFRRRRSASQP